ERSTPYGTYPFQAGGAFRARGPLSGSRVEFYGGLTNPGISAPAPFPFTSGGGPTVRKKLSSGPGHDESGGLFISPDRSYDPNFGTRSRICFAADRGTNDPLHGRRSYSRPGFRSSLFLSASFATRIAVLYQRSRSFTGQCLK